MKDPLRPIDLRESARRGIDHISRGVDRRRDCRPYFRFNLTQKPVWARHEAGDAPHTVGRFLHALNVCRPLVGLPDDTQLIDGLRRQLLSSCKGDGYAWDDMAYEPQPVMAFMHHQREALLGLLALWDLRADTEAAEKAHRLVAAAEKATRASGTFPGKTLAADGWQRGEHQAVTTSERAIAALLAYGCAFDRELGLELALRFGRHALSVTFGPEGDLTPAAGTHIHSITGTIASLVELGLKCGQEEIVERARLVFENGLLPYRTRTGWIKESVNAHRGRGEANCTADLIEAACLLGAAGYTGYYAEAERMLRNHLLASQLDDLTWVQENEGMEDSHTHGYKDLRQRALGAFCFAEPNGYHSYNSDLTGAALQGIAAAWGHIAAEEADGTQRVNLLFSYEDEGIEIDSRLPVAGRVTIALKKWMPALQVRLPPWCERRGLEARLDGEWVEPEYAGEYLAVRGIQAGACVELSFGQPEYTTLERALGYDEPYRVRWRGDTVLAMSGATQHMPLYPALL